ncbi:NadD Nicotinic acid mononucleotide adenylyltransferase [Burkholderiales bacterium]
MTAADPLATPALPALGLFGGRFDPVHRAHVAMAQAAADQLGLSEVRWLVTAAPVHKPAVASPAQRLDMVRLALDDLGDPRMVADDREISLAQGGRANPTWVTIESLQRDFPGRPLVWIMGEDQLQAFTTWHRWEWLVQNMALAVCARPELRGVESTGANPEERGAEERPRRVPQQRTLDRAPPGARILPVSFTADAVSSSQVREAIHRGLPIDALVPRAVARFLETHPVYTSGG